MPREVVTLQIGQAGNQIGRSFWSRALEEHHHQHHQQQQQQPQLQHQHQSQQHRHDDDKKSNSSSQSREGEFVFTESMSSFFHHYGDESPNYQSSSIVRPGQLKARAVLVDMEEGVVAETLRGPLGGLFEAHQYLTDVSGAGNNFAHGHFGYGPKYGDTILEAVRGATELCDSLQSFFIMHSLGGGTGSGLGTYILGLLEDDFPGVHRFVTAVFPSEDDDVVTSPYNSVLALQQLTEHADCVLPVENGSLMDIVGRPGIILPSDDGGNAYKNPLANLLLVTSSSPPIVRRGKQRREIMAAADAAAAATSSAATYGVDIAAATTGSLPNSSRAGFDDANSIVARLLLDLTASMRFGGDLNVDLNEITTNLVPYPRLHYLMSSLSHLGDSRSGSGNGNRGGSKAVGRNRNYEVDAAAFSSVAANSSHQLNSACKSVFARQNQLMRADPRSGTMVASALLFRGQNLSLADVTTNVQRLQTEMRMVPWNPDGFKVGLCSVPSLATTTTTSRRSFPLSSSSPSLLCLSNNSCIADTLRGLGGRFQKLYRRRAMVHHYEEYMDPLVFEEARDDLRQLVEDYSALGQGRGPEQGAFVAAPRRRPSLFM